MTGNSVPLPFSINLSGFKNWASIPKIYTYEGQNISPALSWDGAPAGTRSFMLIMDDPDAPVGTWIHWVMYNIQPDIKGLPEAVAPLEKLMGASNAGRITLDQNSTVQLAVQGINSWNKIGYGGPYPPPGKAHRYFFKLYALKTFPNLPTRLNAIQVQARTLPDILAKAEWMGTYQR